MKDIKVLDCTLRDGGYVNDWNFGHNNLVSMFERSIAANIDIIEIGFLDDRREFDINRSIMPDTDCVERIYGDIDKKNAMVVGMIDYGTCDISNIKRCSESYLDGIRVIFKKHLMCEAMEYCAKLKKLGYKVFAQLVSVTSYSDEEMLALIKLANEVKPYAVSMVDTYGLMNQNMLEHYFKILDNNLDKDISLGYHAHNNFQLGFANCIAMLRIETERPVLVDGSVYGMGKSAGNAPLELITMHLNQEYGKKYNIAQLLEIIDANIFSFYKPASWGYNLFFYLAASNKCHPTYVSDLMKKKTLSVKQINELLGRLEGEKRLLYDGKYMEQLYLDYQMNDIDDSEDIEKLKDIFGKKEILILGTGESVKNQEAKLKEFIEKKNPIVISMNYIPDNIVPDMIFLSNSKKYVQMMSTLLPNRGKYKIIATSNVTKTNGNFDYTIKYSDLIEPDNAIFDLAFTMLMKTMLKTEVKEVYLGGIDGFNKQHDGIYLDSNEECVYDVKYIDELNKYVRKTLEKIKDKMKVNFLTTTIYE